MSYKLVARSMGFFPWEKDF